MLERGNFIWQNDISPHYVTERLIDEAVRSVSMKSLYSFIYLYS